MSGSSTSESARLRRGESDTEKKSAGTPHLIPRGVIIWAMLKAVAIAVFFAHFTIVSLLIYFVPDVWLFYQFVAPSARGFGPTYARFRTSEKEVWLTIDDGPDPQTTPKILDLLDQYQARATFFTIGKNVAENSPLTAAIAHRGHEVANHTQTHPANRLWRMPPQQLREELDGGQLAIQQATGQFPARFRAPVGVKNIFLHGLLEARGLDLIAWSSRGYDCISKPDTAMERIVRSIKPGAIILVHEGNGEAARVELIERVLLHLREQGYRAIIPSRDRLVG